MISYRERSLFMYVICNRNDLMKSVGIVSKAVSTRTTMAILEDILLDAEGGSLTLVGNDLDLGIQTTIEAVVKKEAGSNAVIPNIRWRPCLVKIFRDFRKWKEDRKFFFLRRSSVR